MRVVTTQKQTREGLQGIRRDLRDSLGQPTASSWSFPGGGRDAVPTWFGEDVLGRPLAVGIGADGTWSTRTPILVARGELKQGMTPAVELNIPIPDGGVNRTISGCLCQTDENDYFLAHRGNGLTVTPRKIPKHVMHRSFAKWLVEVEDGDRHTPVIPAAPSGEDLIPHLARFTDAVLELKAAWTETGGQESELQAHMAWRDELNFPQTISRAVSASTGTFEYRHGPVQAALQEALQNHLQAPFKVGLNQMVDLAILKKDDVLAIFEVKTGLGSQLYSAIGQLFWYRQIFGSKATALFLVLPEDGRTETEVRIVGKHLADLGIMLLLYRGRRFLTWNGIGFIKSLSEAGVAIL